MTPKHMLVYNLYVSFRWPWVQYLLKAKVKIKNLSRE